MSRNYQLFEALEFLAEVTQHIPNKGQHLIRYFGWYSNKKRGVRKKKEAAADRKQDTGPGDGNDNDISLLKERRMSWAALIKKVYEADPLRCPACGGIPPGRDQFYRYMSTGSGREDTAALWIVEKSGLAAAPSEKHGCRNRAQLRLWLL